MLERIDNVISKVRNLLGFAILECLIGLFLLISPSGMAQVILSLCGLVLLIFGVLKCLSYFKQEPVAELSQKHPLAFGLFLLISGFFFLFNHRFIVGIFPVLAALYGLIAMMFVFLKIERLVTDFRIKSSIWYMTAGSLLFTFIVMLVLYTAKLPFISSGILLLMTGIIDLVTHLQKRGKIILPEFSPLIARIRNNARHSSESAQHADNISTGAPSQIAPAGEENIARSNANISVPSDEQASASSDPADEDMSWAAVPQLDMSE
ncbi:MAG: DUF308 domain-containing protein [Clostridia bacterium]|nr:DUF308 domain-containing protein [Clostridia bacterium]